jgi:hypothetical protein
VHLDTQILRLRLKKEIKGLLAECLALIILNKKPMKYLDLKFSEEEMTSIHDLAGCNYSPEKIALFLDVDKKAFMQLWYQKESAVRTAYDRGKLVSEFKINGKQKELAESGNITATQIFIGLRETTEVERIRDQILYGHEDVD